MRSRIKKRQESKKKKWFYWIGATIIVSLLIFGASFFGKVKNTFSSIHDPLERDTNQERQKNLKKIFKESKSLNILLLGVDERPGDKGRSDTMILMSLNPNTNSIAMLSIPRDTYVNIPGRSMDKINHAYSFGDVELSIQTVEQTLDLPIHFYAKVNMKGFKEGIDAIGGVTVHNDLDFTQGSHQFQEGQIHMDGKESLEYIRMRKNDPQGDLGRNKRQREVIEAAIDEIASFSSITKIGSILNILGENVKTDLNMGRIQTLFTDYRNTRKNINTIELKGQGKFIGPYWYYVVNDEEFNRIHSEIKDHMEETG